MRRRPLIAYPSRKGTAPVVTKPLARGLLGALLLGGCPSTTSEDAPTTLGPDCATLLEVAQRAEACDPTLATLRATLQRAPDEGRCRAAARRLLHRSREPAAELASLYRPSDAPPAGPLTAAERDALGTKRFPATLDLVPDVRGEPGLTPTRAWLDERELAVSEDGSLHATAAPGKHTVRIKYGSEERVLCVRLAECEAVGVVLHGASPARHATLSAGPCSETTATEDDASVAAPAHSPPSAAGLVNSKFHKM